MWKPCVGFMSGIIYGGFICVHYLFDMTHVKRENSERTVAIVDTIRMRIREIYVRQVN